MIFFDVTSAGKARHKSGLMRVSDRLLEGLGAAATPISWASWDRKAGKDDWYFTPELFAPDERPGFREFLKQRSCKCGAVFYDAIPLKLPHITWPKSVARHPSYMKMLAQFDRIWAISAASREEVLGFWKWQEVGVKGTVDVLGLGADGDGSARGTGPSFFPAGGTSDGDADKRAALLCVGIFEPRKNQEFLARVAAELWDEGLQFDLHLVGRVNPHFGGPIVKRLRTMQRKYPGLKVHKAASDGEVARLYASARASVFPTVAEGSGLPLLESLWKGVPCLASDLPALRENAAGGGCVLAPPKDQAAWKSALRDILTDDALRERLTAEARTRRLPTWDEAAHTLTEAMSDVEALL